LAFLRGGIFESHSGFGLNIAVALNSDFLCSVVNSVLAGTTTEGVTISTVSITVTSVEAEIAITSLPTNFYDSIQVNLSGSYSGTDFSVVGAATPVRHGGSTSFFGLSALLGAAATSLINTIANAIIDNMLANLQNRRLRDQRRPAVSRRFRIYHQLQFRRNGHLGSWL